MPRGLLYGVGVGPGDPELMTLKAVRIIKACPVVAAPVNAAQESLAYTIASSAVPEMAEKEFLPLPSPMVRNRAEVEAVHTRNARMLERHLDEGDDVAFLTLGDPSLYSTFGYLRHAIEADGYDVLTVSGVTSFCAAAARAGATLAEGDDPLHILPASLLSDINLLKAPGTFVLMKAGARLHEIKAALKARGLRAYAIERCGLEDERVYPDLAHMPDDASYLTLVVASRQQTS